LVIERCSSPAVFLALKEAPSLVLVALAEIGEASETGGHWLGPRRARPERRLDQAFGRDRVDALRVARDEERDDLIPL
jgi:hypothetical protein